MLFPPDCHRHDKEKITGDELNARAKAIAIREGHTGKKTVVETAISTGTTPRKIKMERWIAMCCKVAFSTP
jgi:hypothetical protein